MADSNPLEGDEKRRQNRIDAIVEQQARIDAKLETVTQRLYRLARPGEVLAEREGQLTADVTTLVAGVEVFRREVRSAIDNLISADEVTRDLRRTASRRLSDIEKK